MLRGVVTQNIDMLHQKAGSRVVYELHGSGIVRRCFRCGRTKSFDEICAMLENPGNGDVPICDERGGPFKPDITFFGEPLPEPAFSDALQMAMSADLIMVLGSSLTVYPAASIPVHAVQSGADLVIVNSQPTPMDRFAILRYPDLSVFVDEILALFCFSRACGSYGRMIFARGAQIHTKAQKISPGDTKIFWDIRCAAFRFFPVR